MTNILVCAVFHGRAFVMSEIPTARTPRAFGHIPSYPVRRRMQHIALRAFFILAEGCSLGHFGVDPDSDPPGGVLVEPDFIAPDPHRFHGVFRSLDTNVASVLALSKATPFSSPSVVLLLPHCSVCSRLPFQMISLRVERCYGGFRWFE